MIPHLLAAAALTAAPALAGTLTVGPSGSGATFNDLAPAIAAAAPGDVILVQPGAYQDFGTLVVDKPLTLLGAGSANTSFEALPTNPFDVPLPLLVTGLAVGEEVRIAGLSLGAGVLGGSASGLLVIEDCAGPVVIADVANANTDILTGAPAVAQVRASDQVVFDACSFIAVATGDGSTPPTAGLLVEQSKVYVNDSTVVGASAATLFFQPVVARDGAPAIRVVDSVVRVSRSAVTGGAGTQNSAFAVVEELTAGGAGIEVQSGSALLRGGAGNLVMGGRGGSATVGGMAAVGPGGAGVFVAAPALATTVGDSVVQAGPDFDGATTTPAIAGPGAHLPFAEAYATLGADRTVATLGGNVTFELGGPANGTALTYYSTKQVAALTVAGTKGEVLLDPLALSPLPPRTLDAAGAASFTANVPANPGLVGVSVLVQSVAALSTGEVSFSAPVLVGLH